MRSLIIAIYMDGDISKEEYLELLKLEAEDTLHTIWSTTNDSSN